MSYRPSRRLVITTAVIACLIAAFIVVLPEIVRRVAVNRLENFFTVRVGIGDVDLNLFTGHAAVENLVIGETETRPILSLPVAELEFSWTALLSGQIVFSDILLKQPELFIERVGPSAFNIVRALDISNKSSQGNGGVGFSIRHLGIQSGDVVFIDHTQEPDYQLALSSLSFAAGPISTLPQASDPPTTFRAGVKIGDGSLSLTGSTEDVGKPVTVELKAEVSNVELKTFNVYLPYGERLNLKNSVLNGQARYVNTGDAEKTREHYLNADVQRQGGPLDSLTPGERHKKTLLQIDNKRRQPRREPPNDPKKPPMKPPRRRKRPPVEEPPEQPDRGDPTPDKDTPIGDPRPKRGPKRLSPHHEAYLKRDTVSMFRSGSVKAVAAYTVVQR